MKFVGNHLARYAKQIIVKGPDECWGWNGRRNTHGYGVVEAPVFGRRVVKYAHRVAYETWHGQIAPGLDVMHTCHNPECTNPNHLRLGTRADNMRMSQVDGRLQRKIPLRDLSAIRERRAAGETLQSIADGYGCTKQAVRHMLNREVACLA